MQEQTDGEAEVAFPRAVGTDGFYLRAQPIGGGEGVDIGGPERGAVHALEAQAGVLGAEGGEEGRAIEVGILFGGLEVVGPQGESAEQGKADGGMGGKACVEGP